MDAETPQHLLDILPTLPMLAKLLQDTNHDHIRLTAHGEIYIHNDGQTYLHSTSLPEQDARRLAATISTQGEVCGAWRAHRLEGRMGPTTLFVHAPALTTTFDPVLNTIQQRLSPEDNCLILGAPGHGQWEIASLVARERRAVLISDPAPAHDALQHITHLYPSSGAGLRHLLLHARSVVWHNLTSAQDLSMSIGAVDARARCWTLHTHDTTRGLQTFATWMQSTTNVQLDAVLVLTRDPNTQITIEHFITPNEEGTWTEHVHANPALAIFTSSLFAQDPPTISMEEAPEHDEMMRATTENPALMIRATQDIPLEEVLSVPQADPAPSTQATTLPDVREEIGIELIDVADTSESPQPDLSIFDEQVLESVNPTSDPRLSDVGIPVSPDLANLVAELEEDSDGLGTPDFSFESTTHDPLTQEFPDDEILEISDDPEALLHDPSEAVAQLYVGVIENEVEGEGEAETLRDTEDAITRNVPSKDLDNVLAGFNDDVSLLTPPRSGATPEAMESIPVSTSPSHAEQLSELSWDDEEITNLRKLSAASAASSQPGTNPDASGPMSMLSLKLKALRDKRKTDESEQDDPQG